MCRRDQLHGTRRQSSTVVGLKIWRPPGTLAVGTGWGRICGSADFYGSSCDLSYVTRTILPSRTNLVRGAGDSRRGCRWNLSPAQLAGCFAQRDDVGRRRLYQAGVRPGDPVVQWSENRYEWILADIALQSLQAIHVPLHGSLSPSQAAAQVVHCGARLGLVDQPAKVESLLPHESNFPRNFKLLCYGEGATEQGASRHRMADLVQASSADRGESLVARCGQQADPQAVASILYTSGTTGKPKGIALTHGNLVSNALTVLERFGEVATDVRLCFLPLSHIYARTCDLYTWIGSGSQLALARSRDSILQDCRIVRPTLMNGVPYFFQRVQKQFQASEGQDEQDSLRQFFGGEIRACCCGGAALDHETSEFYRARGVPLLPGYGLTEASPVISMSSLSAAKVGTVGQVLPNVEVRFDEDGEILVRGPNVMLGYWGDDDSTSAAIDAQGWLRTGDLGELDEEGYLSITGRKKELIVVSTGKHVVPTQIESLLCRHPLVQQAMIVGDGQTYLAALIVPNQDELRAIVKQRRLWVWSKKALVRHRFVRALYAKAINKCLKDLARHEQIKEFTILDRPFLQESGHLSAKLSLCREVISKDFSAEITALYATRKSQR